MRGPKLAGGRGLGVSGGAGLLGLAGLLCLGGLLGLGVRLGLLGGGVCGGGCGRSCRRGSGHHSRRHSRRSCGLGGCLRLGVDRGFLALGRLRLRYRLSLLGKRKGLVSRVNLSLRLGLGRDGCRGGNLGRGLGNGRLLGHGAVHVHEDGRGLGLGHLEGCAAIGDGGQAGGAVVARGDGATSVDLLLRQLQGLFHDGCLGDPTASCQTIDYLYMRNGKAEVGLAGGSSSVDMELVAVVDGLVQELQCMLHHGGLGDMLAGCQGADDLDVASRKPEVGLLGEISH